MMWDIIADTLFDVIKLLPFLFLTYLAMEYLEHRAGGKAEALIKKAGCCAPVRIFRCGVQFICRKSDYARNAACHLSVYFG